MGCAKLPVLTSMHRSTMNSSSPGLIDDLVRIVGKRNVLTSQARTRFFRTGFRVGEGNCAAVVLPADLLQLWRTLEVCVNHDHIVLMQAANTGLNGGSTPFGDDYDRELVIINTRFIRQIYLLNDGQQALTLAGSTLFELENQLRPLNRGPHSVIGSSCIGASVIGGICNNSGGNLVNRGPAYTELSLYAQISKEGELQLVNHLGMELGKSPEEILTNLEQGHFPRDFIPPADAMASDDDYKKRVRDTNAITPARFNADKRRLYESSGCAGKLAIFAAILDTFENPRDVTVFYVGTNNPNVLTTMRRRILEDFDQLPEMGEYLHRSYFDGADRYGKDTFLAIRYLGTAFLPRLFIWKSRINHWLAKIPLIPPYPFERLLQLIAELWPNHLPQRMRNFRNRYEHHLIIKATDKSIAATRQMLDETLLKDHNVEYFECDDKEGEAAFLHRFVCGGAAVRYAQIHHKEVGGMLPLDIALPRNEENWFALYDEDILKHIAAPFALAHFLCMVFHHDFVLKKGVDAEALKKRILQKLNERGAKYPAEHNVGHLYKAEADLVEHYLCCDPTNSMNPGIGKTSKRKHYR